MFSGLENDRIPNAIREFLQSQGIIDDRLSSHVDIIETENEVVAYIDIPGIRESSIDIDFFNNRVDIKGTRICHYDNEAQVSLNEIKYGTLERSIMLPISVTSRDSVSLSSNRGVLTISIDKEREAQNRFNMRIDTPEQTESY